MKPTVVAHSEDPLGMGSQGELRSPQSALPDARELPEHVVDSVLETR